MFKHAVLLRWLAALTAAGPGLEVLDTHAGAGLYDLSAPTARSGEAAGGIARVLAGHEGAPGLQALAAAVRAVNGGGGGPLYPGSPVLAAQALRVEDRYVGCELRADDAASLRRALSGRKGCATQVLEADGYAAVSHAAAGGRRAVLIDPPFERGDEAERLAEAAGEALARREPVLIWAPLKDLDGFDRLLGRLEALSPPPSATVELRLRALDDPLKLNGCAMILLGGPPLADEVERVAKGVLKLCGGTDGRVVANAFGDAQPA